MDNSKNCSLEKEQAGTVPLPLPTQPSEPSSSIEKLEATMVNLEQEIIMTRTYGYFPAISVIGLLIMGILIVGMKAVMA